MVGFILGTKVDQTQKFDDKMARMPVTTIETSPCYLVDVVNPQKRGYFAITLGFKQTKNISKPRKGKLKKAGIKTSLRFFKEFRLESYQDKVKLIEKDSKKGIQIGETQLFIGDEVKPELFFKPGDKLMISGVSKGKGFQGGMKRHGFSGGPRTHGQSDRARAPGSIGQTTTPGRVMKGKKMAGRMGGERITVKGLEIVEVKDSLMIVKGLVPGHKGSLLEIKSEVINKSKE